MKCFIFMLLLMSSVAYTTNFDWISQRNTEWNNKDNWNPMGVPNGAADNANIEIINIVAVNGLFELNSLTVGQDVKSLHGHPSQGLIINNSITRLASSTMNVNLHCPIKLQTNPITITNAAVNDRLTLGGGSGKISGSSDLNFVGPGNTRLAGPNTYTGNTIISSGTLTIDPWSITSPMIFNNATLTVRSPGTISGIINGPIGATLNIQVDIISKYASNYIINLNGTHPFSGTTNINVAVLRLNGSLAGPVNIASRGILAGNAQVGPLTNSGLVIPGNSIGTTTVNGDYTQTPSGNLSIQISASGESDLLNVTGSASLDGTLIVKALPGPYDKTATYKIVTTGTGVGGAFAKELFFGNASYQLSYTFNDVILNNSFIGFVTPVSPEDLNKNEKRVDKYMFCPGFLPSNPDLFEVMNTLVYLPPDEFAAALDRLHPTQFGALPLVVLQNSHMMANVVMSNTANLYDCEQCSAESCPSKSGLTTFWVTPVGQWQTQSHIQRQVGFNANTYGVSIGASHLFGSCVNTALGAGYSYTNLGWKKNAGGGHWNSIYLGPSVGFVNKRWFATLLTQGSMNFFSIDRKIQFPGVSRSAHNSHHSYDILARVDGGYQFVWQTSSPVFIIPMARLSYLNIFEEGYTESGAKSINLDIDSKYTSFLQPEALVKVRKEMYVGNICIIPNFELGWIGNIALSSGTYTSSFYKQNLCASDFSVTSFHRFTNQVVFGLGLDVKRIGSFNLSTMYEARVFDNMYVQSARVNFEMEF
ncbi:autotransporter outer membrane beta-barrel domain-containing protein [Simkania sp.]|uniref:autotransporter outer membrane beta-barrel domain-containing protein n=1 Tax=Simkania sp. TaxID=34094 RepID=UPI003B516004